MTTAKQADAPVSSVTTALVGRGSVGPATSPITAITVYRLLAIGLTGLCAAVITATTRPGGERPVRLLSRHRLP